MAKTDLFQLTIKKANEMLLSGEISARELCSFYLDNVSKDNKKINAYLEVFDDVFKQAGEIDKQIKKGKRVSVLAGIPIAVKDNILIKGKKCSAGSKMLENFTAPYDATVIKKLKDEGVVFLGRTNMDEFAMGSSTENSAFGPTKNPYDASRVPGGSSGGSAAAVAMNGCLASLGSDTGGSVRQPAAFCGVVGLKPTYGLVSRNGLVAMASSLDQIGPLAKTAEDVETIFNAIKGRDSLDSTSIYRSPTSIESLSKSDFTIGVPKEFFSLFGENKGVDGIVALNIKKSIDYFKNVGFQIKEVSVPSVKYAIETYYVIMPAEVSSNLARFDGIKYGFSKKEDSLLEVYKNTRKIGFGGECRRRILLGTYVLSAGYYDEYYSQAQKVRSLIKEDFRRIFTSGKDKVDVILSPTTSGFPFKIGEKSKDPLKMYLEDIFTSVANLAGIPAISMPCGFEEVDGKKLPIGLQIMAPWFEEDKLFYLAEILEKNLKLGDN